MTAPNPTSPAPAGAAACSDTAPAGTLAALALLLGGVSESLDALRELLSGFEPTAAHAVAGDVLALVAWRVEFGRSVAVGAAFHAPPHEALIAPDVLARVTRAA